MSESNSDPRPVLDRAEEIARETIGNLRAGRVRQATVRDLGEATAQAKRDHGVGHAIGRPGNSGPFGRS